MFSEHEPHARRYMALAESHAALEAENTRLRAEVERLRNALPALLRVARAAQTVVSVDARAHGGEFWYAEEMERVIPYLAAALAALEAHP